MAKPIWTIPITLQDINLRAKHSLSEHLGIEFTELGDDFLSAAMPVDSRTSQPMGILHGGATCALAETVGSAAANYCIGEEKVALGLDINVNHIRAVRLGNLITAVAKPLHLGKSTHVWEIKIYNALMQLVAVSRLTMAIVEKKRISKEI